MLRLGSAEDWARSVGTVTAPAPAASRNSRAHPKPGDDPREDSGRLRAPQHHQIGVPGDGATPEEPWAPQEIPDATERDERIGVAQMLSIEGPLGAGVSTVGLFDPSRVSPVEVDHLHGWRIHDRDA